MRIAVVGAGISGLVAAHQLSMDHDLHVFEAGDWVGGHTHTVPVETEGGAVAVDTGFIVLNDRNYPGFERLLERLGVPTQPAPMSFSVADGDGTFEWSSGSVNGMFACRGHVVDPAFHRMLRDLLRFQRDARSLIGLNGSGPTLGDWLDGSGYSCEFVERLLVPQASAVWSSNPREMWSFPASFLAEFFDNHGQLGLRGRPRWRAVTGGSARYVERLAAPFAERIRTSTPVEWIERHREHVALKARGQEPEHFDHVVLALHSDQALGLLRDPSDREREILSAIPYQPNDVVLHTDRTLLPRRRRAWASWNFHLLDDPPPRTTVTYDMNRLQSLDSAEQFCVTLNRTEQIDPGRVLGRWTYDHPVFTREGVAAQARHAEISGVRRTHYCGAYWGWGFHEDGVQSALRACERFGRGALA
ncbi:MAG TPA: FAD-dependent oxidoreductase [Solirubrobacterales bacterium]|nr:FAD-dependent oxidoreductase [Solirubrobacterales bacterium]